MPDVHVLIGVDQICYGGPSLLLQAKAGVIGQSLQQG